MAYRVLIVDDSPAMRTFIRRVIESSGFDLSQCFEAGNGADLQVLQELNAKRRQFTDAAQQVLGTAYGEMEANAAMVLGD